MAVGAAVSPSTLSTGSTPLFVFGSLMDSDLLQVVLNRAIGGISRAPAQLPGFSRQRVADEAFPMLIEMSSCDRVEAEVAGPTVDGHLLHGLGQGDVERLIYFEGPGYALSTVEVLAPQGQSDQAARLERRRRTSARTFLATEQLTDSGEPWDLSHWQRTEKPLALYIADELMRFFGQIPSEEIEGDAWDALKDRAWSRLRQGEGLRSLTDP
jgi:hypothetical protein